MNKKIFAVLLLSIVPVFLATTLVYANATSYHGLTTIGYGVGNIHLGGSNWDAYRVEYTTQPYYFMDQIGASFWSSWNTCDGATNWYSYQGYSYPWYISQNARSSHDGIALQDYPCQSGQVVGRVSSVTHWWKSSGFNADGTTSPPKVSSIRTTFLDVPTDQWAYSLIEPMYQIGILDPIAIQHRCTTNNFFCPDYSVRRDEMAYFLERGMRGSNYTFPAPTGIFSDAPTSYWNASVIEKLYADGITSGCGINPLQFCPDSRVTRAEMAVFLLRAEHGSSYTPPPVGSSTGFVDVPTTHWAAAFIKQLVVEGITVGCNANPPYYCPDTWTTRDQMAVFLQRTFAP